MQNYRFDAVDAAKDASLFALTMGRCLWLLAQHHDPKENELQR
jgi:hypothetical protein